MIKFGVHSLSLLILFAFIATVSPSQNIYLPFGILSIIMCFAMFRLSKSTYSIAYAFAIALPFIFILLGFHFVDNGFDADLPYQLLFAFIHRLLVGR